MPTRSDPWPDGTPCWVDLAVHDVAAARDFYGAVSQPGTTRPSTSDPVARSAGSAIWAGSPRAHRRTGWPTSRSPTPTLRWRPPATVGVDPADTPYGRIAVISDPNGATFALMGPTAEQARPG